MALALVLWRGGVLTMEGVIRVGTLSVFMTYAVGMLEPIQQIITSLSALISIQVNIERFTALLNEESDVRDTPEVVEKYGDNFHAKKENWEPLFGDVEFRDVSFMYPDGNELVLEHFNLKVPQGKNVAIVGETGAGKSTLVNLACRFYEPTEGQVLIDGRDARERSQLWLHSKIGYVLQTPYLFSGTVRDNLRYGKPDATDEEILEALRLASADFVVNRMEKGLDSEVGEGGDMLSTGEKQLLSIARAILADPRILVLDEATSSVDTLTERAIQDAIAAVIRGRTSFVIAHRLSTIIGADVILAVRDGKILEQGTHSELMEKKGYYYQLYTKQYEETASHRAVDSVLAAGADESAAKEAAAEMTEETEEAAADMGAADQAAPAAETQNAAPVTEAQKAASDSESVNGAAKASVKDEKIDAVALLGDMRGDYVKLEFISAEEAASGGERRVPEYSKEREEALSSALENGETRVAMFTDTGKPVYYVYLTDSKGDEDKVTFYENGYVGIDTIPGVVMKVPEDTFEAAMEIFR